MKIRAGHLTGLYLSLLNMFLVSCRLGKQGGWSGEQVWLIWIVWSIFDFGNQFLWRETTYIGNIGAEKGDQDWQLGVMTFLGLNMEVNNVWLIWNGSLYWVDKKQTIPSGRWQAKTGPHTQTHCVPAYIYPGLLFHNGILFHCNKYVLFSFSRWLKRDATLIKRNVFKERKTRFYM